MVVLGLVVMAQAGPARASSVEPHAGVVLCSPETPYVDTGECHLSGPASYLNRMAAEGVRMPMQALPATRPSPELARVNNLYARVVSPGAPVYASLEEAVRGDSPAFRIEPGFDFITYIDRAEVDGRPYYMIDPGAWMVGGDLSRLSALPGFQGLEFQRNPRNDFGWVLFETRSRRTPGYVGDDFTGRIYFRYHLVQIFDRVEVEGADWVLIGPDEWMEGRHVAGVRVDPTPPEGVENGRWVAVNLAEQTLAVYENRRLAFATVMSSGVPGQWTQPGLFQVYQKKETETMRGSFTADRSDYYYLEGVPWTIYFDQARALHGTYWHNSFGVPTSRGCVNLSPGDARWVFDWIQEGDWVYVWDPTGATPTDPSIYGAGGA